MPAELGVVHHGAVIANLDVVPEMAADHEHVAVANAGDSPAVGSSSVDRDVFAKDVAVPDPHRRRFAAVGPVLRALAQHRPVPDEVLGPHGQRAGQAGMAFDDALRADSRPRPR